MLDIILLIVVIIIICVLLWNFFSRSRMEKFTEYDDEAKKELDKINSIIMSQICALSPTNDNLTKINDMLLRNHNNELKLIKLEEYLKKKHTKITNIENNLLTEKQKLINDEMNTQIDKMKTYKHIKNTKLKKLIKCYDGKLDKEIGNLQTIIKNMADKNINPHPVDIQDKYCKLYCDNNNKCDVKNYVNKYIFKDCNNQK